MPQELYIGLMSGTSMDGIDGVLCGFLPDGSWDGVRSHAHHPFADSLRAELFALQQPGPNELPRAALAANALARAYANVCADLLLRAEVHAGEVRAIGAHGQTVRHQPGAVDGTGYTIQLLQGNLLAELADIDVITDFRNRDLAAGGQGAPLVPPFHRALFERRDTSRAVVNIGGISNLTVLDPTRALLGFDCGPGNALLDHWCSKHNGTSFDAAGQWAASGQVLPALLAKLLAEPYLAAPPPKSTGRDLFNPSWLMAQLGVDTTAQPCDVQATLSEFTASVIAHDVIVHAAASAELLVCGGGALNTDLMQRLQRLLPKVRVRSTAEFDLPPLQVEASAFGWLARQHCHREAASITSVTGARGPRVLGACYPA